MSKIAFSKLSLKKKDEVKIITIADQEIEVKQYLPINEKVEVVTKVLEGCRTDTSYENPMQMEVLMTMYIIMYYTNISFTDKQKEDLPKLYDLFTESGYYKIISEAIPEDELDMMKNFIWESSSAVFNYKNSALGILENIKANYENISLDATQLQNIIKDPQSLSLLKQVLERLG